MAGDVLAECAIACCVKDDENNDKVDEDGNVDFKGLEPSRPHATRLKICGTLAAYRVVHVHRGLKILHCHEAED